MKSSADISDCGKFRYRLSRDWDILLPRATFIMLNPSTADASKDDPTIRKCIGFSQRFCLGGFDVVNLFAYRATDPKDLKKNGFQTGRDNDDAIELAVQGSDVVICAWGAHARGLARPGEVLALLKGLGSIGRSPKAIKLLSDGVPAHPLMLAYTDGWIDMATGATESCWPVRDVDQSSPLERQR